MKLPESSVGSEAAIRWKTYSVSRSEKEPLLQFILQALRMRNCEVIFTSGPNRAPFYIVFETPAGERHGLLAYAFYANTIPTRNRPSDEHRFQIKYGSELRGILEIELDSSSLITTIFLGIDTKRGIFVAADPVLNNPSPMSRSIEFKSANVDDIIKNGWAAWERVRRPSRTKSRPTARLDDDTRVQVLVGGTQDRLLDLIQLERLGVGLDPGERHLLADKFAQRAIDRAVPASSHRLLAELSIPPDALFDLIDGASRLKMAVRGWVAESHLVDSLAKLEGVTDCRRIEAEGQPDISLRWKGSPPLLIECKNVLRQRNSAGLARVDFQRTRASKEDPCSRYYKPIDFNILSACLHAVTEEWIFSFALTSDLPLHRSCEGRIASNVVVADPVFTPYAELAFDKCSA